MNVGLPVNLRPGSLVNVLHERPDANRTVRAFVSLCLEATMFLPRPAKAV